MSALVQFSKVIPQKSICFTVTTDLSYDQRMIRICTALAEAGYNVTLVGRLKANSIPLITQPYRQKRLFTWAEKGKLFYLEYNIRLFLWLLFNSSNVFCAIDLDSILPVWLASRILNKKRVYDAHELFCEMKEIVTRPSIHRIWKRIERFAVPRFEHGYTVNEPIAAEFHRMYGVHYSVVRNVPMLRRLNTALQKKPFILYQGTVNEGRSFETLIPAMQWVDIPLIICGDGNFMKQVQALIKQFALANKVVLKGLVPPDELWTLTQEALVGITLFENNGLSNYLSLANRFFDYIHAGTPQLCVDYPSYAAINNQTEIAVMVQDLRAEHLAKQMNELLTDKLLYTRLRNNCLGLREQIHWGKEKQALILFYRKIFDSIE